MSRLFFFCEKVDVHNLPHLLILENKAITTYPKIPKDTILSRVTNTFTKSWQKMVRIVAGGDTITATNNHPFYLPQLGKYLRVDSLRQNMKLLALTGALLTVHAVEAFDTTLQVYNFEVEEYHNYFVGKEGVLVHNDCAFIKAGIQGENPDGTIFNRFDEAFTENPNREILKNKFRQDLGALDEADEAAVQNFFRAVDVGGDILTVQAQIERVRAWERLHTLLPSNLKHFAADVEHLKFFQSPDVQNSLSWVIDRRANLFDDYPDLIPGEIIALNHFTTEQGYQINFWLRGTEVTGVQLWDDEFANTFLGFMDSAFEKLPNYDSPVFIRIEGGNSSDFALNRESFVSFAKSKFSSFIHGARSNNTDIVESYIVKLTSSSNKIIDMEPFSQVPFEKEVLVYRDINFNINEINYEQFPLPMPEEIMNSLPVGHTPFEEIVKGYEIELNKWAGNTSNPNRLDFDYDNETIMFLDEEHLFFEQQVKGLLGENAYETDAYQNAISIKTIYVNGN